MTDPQEERAGEAAKEGHGQPCGNGPQQKAESGTRASIKAKIEKRAMKKMAKK